METVPVSGRSWRGGGEFLATLTMLGTVLRKLPSQRGTAPNDRLLHHPSHDLRTGTAHVTRQAPPREVPGAGSPLTQTVVAGPWQHALVLASFPTALYLSVGAHHEVLPVVTSDALMLPTAVRLSAAARDLAWGVQPGETVTVGRSEIRLPGLHIRVVREWRPGSRISDRPTVTVSPG